ncbi:MAG: cupin domain-containing protein [Labrys sp. (in: a-proteobacteria)]
MAKHVFFAQQPGGEPELGMPKPERLIAGEPRTRTWVTYESADGKTFCGVWEATPGAWRVEYDEWESCTILAGRNIVTPDGGEPVVLEAGDTLVLEPGFKGVWSVEAETRKTFVIRI